MGKRGTLLFTFISVFASAATPLLAHASSEIKSLRHALVCEAVLMGIVPKSSEEGLAREQSGVAVRVLRDFRNKTLGMHLVEAGSGNISAVSELASHAELERIAQRIRSLEDDTQSLTEADRFALGRVYRGKEQILEFLSAYEKSAQQLHGIYAADRANEIGQKLLSVFSYLFTAAFTAAHVAAGDGFHGELFFGAMLGGLFGPELLFKIAAATDAEFRERLQEMRQFIGEPRGATAEKGFNPEKAPWIYWGRDQEVNRAWVEKYLNEGKVNEDLLHMQNQREIHSWMQRLMRRFNIEFMEKVGASAWLELDQLLTVDPDGQPVLTVLVRGSEERPDVPKKGRRIRVPKLKESLDGVLDSGGSSVLAPVPTR